jgi:hypothetical protein
MPVLLAKRASIREINSEFRPIPAKLCRLEPIFHGNFNELRQNSLLMMNTELLPQNREFSVEVEPCGGSFLRTRKLQAFIRVPQRSCHDDWPYKGWAGETKLVLSEPLERQQQGVDLVVISAMGECEQFVFKSG